jgi:hypothetical protein
MDSSQLNVFSIINETVSLGKISKLPSAIKTDWESVQICLIAVEYATKNITGPVCSYGFHR